MVRLILVLLLALQGCAKGQRYEEIDPQEMSRLANECYDQGMRAVWIRKLGNWTVECRPENE